MEKQNSGWMQQFKVSYTVSLLFCDPGINQRQPLLTVASSRAIHSPKTLPKGSVYRNVASWCGVTKKKKTDRKTAFNSFYGKNVYCITFTYTCLYIYFLNQFSFHYLLHQSLVAGGDREKKNHILVWTSHTAPSDNTRHVIDRQTLP